MARSFKRMVHKNSKLLDHRRKKLGRIHANFAVSGVEVFKGRSWIVPALLLGFVTLYCVFAKHIHRQVGLTTWDWIVVSMYGFLALVYWLRRPYVRVDKKEITRVRGNRKQTIAATNISGITLKKNRVIIEFDEARKRWVFTRYLHRYHIDALGQTLQQFAKLHKVPVETKSGGNISSKIQQNSSLNWE